MTPSFLHYLDSAVKKIIQNYGYFFFFYKGYDEGEKYYKNSVHKTYETILQHSENFLFPTKVEINSASDIYTCTSESEKKSSSEFRAGLFVFLGGLLF